MMTLITDTNEYTFNTREEVVAKANELALEAKEYVTFDYEEDDVYFGFGSCGYLTIETFNSYVEEEKELLANN